MSRVDATKEPKVDSIVCSRSAADVAERPDDDDAGAPRSGHGSRKDDDAPADDARSAAWRWRDRCIEWTEPQTAAREQKKRTAAATPRTDGDGMLWVSCGNNCRSSIFVSFLEFKDGECLNGQVREQNFEQYFWAT
mmetsp:Transcript_40230/g.78647  ORF Transcript_40230/g.78647 Transcript_40230/m.78647 type:complete len:136 (+) Transcript_40230:496-903(+)